MVGDFISFEFVNYRVVLSIKAMILLFYWVVRDREGSPFEFRNANNPEEVNYLNWDAFPDSTSTFAPSEKQFMINYRVQNIEQLVNNLEANGVVIVDELATYEYGKFIHIMDPEGNKIELWEPVDSVLSKMGRVTNK